MDTVLCKCGCENPVSKGRDFLTGHHWKTRTPDDYFWPKVQKTETCWLWTGAITSTKKHGYGATCPGGRKIMAHRFSWELHFGPIPDGLLVCHHCDVPLCVNPEHLFLGTHLDNMRDKMSKGRGNNRNSHGHPPGEGHPMAKLTWKQVRNIRATFHDSGLTMTGLGKLLGVSVSTISLILKNKVWIEQGDSLVPE